VLAPVSGGRERHVLGHGEVVVEAEGLGHVAEAGPGLARRWLAEQPDAAGGGVEQAEQHADQRRLAGAVGPDQTDHLAGGHR
jgi:hypothetical protein